jgi:hypothetical protein
MSKQTLSANGRHPALISSSQCKAGFPLCLVVIRKCPVHARRAFSREQDEIFSINPVNGMCHLILSSWINDLVSGP